MQDFQSIKAFEVQAFEERQINTHTEAAKRLEYLMDKVQASIAACCSSATERARHFTKLMKEEEDFDARERNRHKSLVILKEEQGERLRMMRQTQHEVSVLGDLIRLADYLMLETVRSIIITAQASFLQELRQPKIKSGLLETTVKFGATAEEGMIFEPTCNNVLTMFRRKTRLLLEMMDHVPRILYARKFKAFVTDKIGIGSVREKGLGDSSSRVLNPSQSFQQAGVDRVGSFVQPGQLIRSSPDFNAITLQIEEKVNADFAEAVTYAKQFESVRPIVDFRITDYENEQAERRKESETASSSFIEEVLHIRKHMDQCQLWEKDVERMRPGGTIGILYVESRKLKNSLSPITEKFWVTLREN